MEDDHGNKIIPEERFVTGLVRFVDLFMLFFGHTTSIDSSMHSRPEPFPVVLRPRSEAIVRLILDRRNGEEL